MTEKKYPIGGYAPGSYQCKCCTCGNSFIGEKRAVQCEPCAVKGKEAYDALSEEEKQEHAARYGNQLKEFIEKDFHEGILNAVYEGSGQWKHEAEIWQMRFEMVRAALLELVELKEMKDTKGKTLEYEKRQPEAWKFAREVLNKIPTTKPTNP